MTKLQIPQDAFVFVGDGRKALFLRNAGDAKFPNLKTERVFLDDNPATHDAGHRPSWPLDQQCRPWPQQRAANRLARH